MPPPITNQWRGGGGCLPNSQSHQTSGWGVSSMADHANQEVMVVFLEVTAVFPEVAAALHPTFALPIWCSWGGTCVSACPRCQSRECSLSESAPRTPHMHHHWNEMQERSRKKWTGFWKGKVIKEEKSKKGAMNLHFSLVRYCLVPSTNLHWASGPKKLFLLLGLASSLEAVQRD